MVLVGIFHGLMSKDARIAGRFATSKAFSAMLHQRCVRTHVEVVASSREGGMVQGEARGKRQQERQHCSAFSPLHRMLGGVTPGRRPSKPRARRAHTKPARGGGEGADRGPDPPPLGQFRRSVGRSGSAGWRAGWPEPRFGDSQTRSNSPFETRSLNSPMISETVCSLFLACVPSALQLPHATHSHTQCTAHSPQPTAHSTAHTHSAQPRLTTYTDRGDTHRESRRRTQTRPRTHAHKTELTSENGPHRVYV